MKITLKLEEINKSDYNFIISNHILAKTNKFTYDDIANELKDMFGEINSDIEQTLNKCLIRLRDDDFLSILGSNYSVRDVHI